MRTNSREDIGIVLALRLDFKEQLTNAFTKANKRPLLHYKITETQFMIKHTGVKITLGHRT